jgi:hypothetical protein
VKDASLKLAEQLLQMKGASSLDTQAAIVEMMHDKILAAVSLKALAGSEKAAQIFFERADRLAQLKARKNGFTAEGVRDITPSSEFVQPAREEADTAD